MRQRRQQVPELDEVSRTGGLFQVSPFAKKTYRDAVYYYANTLDAVFALASSTEARRGHYVDMTRAREDVTIAYGKNDVNDFGETHSGSAARQRESARA